MINHHPSEAVAVHLVSDQVQPLPYTAFQSDEDTRSALSAMSRVAHTRHARRSSSAVLHTHGYPSPISAHFITLS